MRKRVFLGQFVPKSGLKRFLKDFRGSATPFFAIFLSVVVLLNFAFVDALRIHSQKNLSERLVADSVDFGLSKYNSYLEEGYGIYCVTEDDSDEITNRIYEIISDGSYSETKLNSKVFSMPEISFSKSLGEEGVFEGEIAALMEYKAWGNAAELVAEKVIEITGAEKQMDLVSKEKELGEAEEEYETLKKEISGLCEEINGFFNTPYAESNSELLSNITEIVENYDTLANAEIALTSLKLYGTGVTVYDEICSETLQKCEKIIKLQEKIQEITAEIEENDEEDSAKNVIEEAKQNFLKDDWTKLQNEISANYKRLEAAKSDCNAYKAATSYGTLTAKKLLKKAVDSIAFAYENFAKVSFETDIKSGEAEAVLDYQKADTETASENFFGSCKAEIDDEIYEALPSKTLENIGEDDTYKLSEIVKEAYFVDEYAMTYFKDASEDTDLRCQYLAGEIEYLIGGKQSDEENLKIVYAEILAMRIALNTTFLYTNSEKSQLLDEAAAAISVATEGMGKDIYKAILAVEWATLEAVYDLELLEGGDSVPLVKTASDWNTDLFSDEIDKDGSDSLPSLEDLQEDNESYNLTSMNYSDYLRVCLSMVSKEKKLARMLDLLELNMYKKFNKYTEIEELYTQISVESDFSINTLFYAKFGENKYKWQVTKSGGYV